MTFSHNFKCRIAHTVKECSTLPDLISSHVYFTKVLDKDAHTLIVSLSSIALYRIGAIPRHLPELAVQR